MHRSGNKSPAPRSITERSSDDDGWAEDFRQHVEEDGGLGAVQVTSQAMVEKVRILTMGRLSNVPIGKTAVAYGVEPTVWAVIDDAHDVHDLHSVLAARQRSLQVALQVRLVRPQDGARATFVLPMRHDIHDTMRSTSDFGDTMQRIQRQLFRHFDAAVARLGGAPTCVLCGACADVGANGTELRVVSDDVDVPFVEVSVRRKCAACAHAASAIGFLVGETEEVRERARDDFHEQQLARVRTRAAVRVAADRRNPAALVAALEAALELPVWHADIDQAHADLSYAADVLVALVHTAPHVAGHARAVLRRVSTWPQMEMPRDDMRLCASCNVSKSVADYSANQWRKGRRRCRACQAGGVTRDAETEVHARADADALAAAFVDVALRERERLTEELARRNANEHTDDECVICFQSTMEGERSVLHGAHWVCLMCREDMRTHSIEQCPMCRESITD